MGFKRNAAPLVAVLLFSSAFCIALDTDGILQITVLVQNHAKLPQQFLKSAEGEASRIFRAAGVHVRWVDCSKGDLCRHVPGAGEFVLNIVPDGKTSSDLIYGIAFLGPEGEGKYADVFFRRIEAACTVNGSNVQRFLGTIAAHELGHLLLGSHAHTYEGLMSSVWTDPVLRRVNMGSLLFTREESMAIKARLGAAGEVPAYTVTRSRPITP
ncbi:MAG TPA: hypothetical protein VJQ54_09750 [Candidatus Sulfotelmatobacter sp.]|nr:hypothetical protein [Candidatus Sulfotelmatobacter sp.]